jgi:hypothetical protein
MLRGTLLSLKECLNSELNLNFYYSLKCPDDEIGRHTRLKILGSKDRASSSLALGIPKIY